MGRLFPFLAIILLLASCGEKGSNKALPPGRGQSLVVSLTGTGQVKRKRNSSWETLRGGEIIETGQEVRLQEGEMYLLTGEGVLIAMEERAKLIYSYDKRSDSVRISLGKEGIAISNPGVRLSLEFSDLSLYSDEGDFSLTGNDERLEIYNHRGDLRLLPGIADLGRLIQTGDEGAMAAAEELPLNQRPLFPGETWYLDREVLSEHSQKYDDLILKMSATPLSPVQLQEEINAVLTMGITISEFSRVDWRNRDRARELFSLDGDEAYYRLAIRSEEGALIETDYTTGTTGLNVALPSKKTLNATFRKAGYEKTSVEVDPSHVSSYQERLFFKLPRMTSRKIAINITPPESEITINEIYAGKGSLVLELKPDEPLELNATLEGYNELYLHLDGEREWPETIELELKKTVEKVMRGAYQEITGIASLGEDVYVADWSGTVWYIHEPTNWRRFNTRTSNYPNTLSTPVVTDSYVYLSGKKNFVAINRTTGATISVTRLNDRENHLLGQSALPMGYQLLYPTKDSLRFLTGDGKKIRELFIPGGSLMTPALYGEKIYTVATDGIVYEISKQGKILRTLETGAESPKGQSVVFRDGKGYFCDSQGRVTAFSADNMTTDWTTPPLSDKGSFLYDVKLTDDRIYVYSGQKLYALDRMTGKILTPLDSQVLTDPLLLGPYIYGITGEEEMGVFSSETGEFVKTIELEYIITSPLYAYGDKIMAGAYDGNILLLNQLDPSLLSKPIK